jgi:nucleoside-diphosphate-sugar epimerase
MRILITGGAGFLGYHLASKVIKEKHKLSLLDIADFDRSEYPGGVEFYQGDVRDSELLSKIMPNVDLVIHAAAALPLWSRQEIFSINVKGTRNVLDIARKNGVQRVIFISSTAVYGIPEKHPILESDPLIGVGPYGESKIMAEEICLKYRERGMCVPIIRPKTFIGIGRLGVFQILFDWVQSGKRIPIIGSGKNRYQLLEVEDLVEAIFSSATQDANKVNDTFNVGAKHFGTVREDVSALCDFAGTGARVMATPACLVKIVLRLFELLKLSPLYKWVYDTADKDSFVSIEKVESKLGWTPRYSNAEGLIHSYKWYLEHRREMENKVGITHRVAWKQGILGILKKFL